MPSEMAAMTHKSRLGSPHDPVRRRTHLCCELPCLFTLIWVQMSLALAETSQLSCSGTATFPKQSKLPATVNRMLIGIDFDNRAVSGFGHRLSIVNTWQQGLIKVAGNYRDAEGPIRVRGSINLVSGRTKIWGSRGVTGRGPLVFLWELICGPARFFATTRSSSAT
jgi:hypothetical protein